MVPTDYETKLLIGQLCPIDYTIGTLHGCPGKQDIATPWSNNTAQGLETLTKNPKGETHHFAGIN